MTAMPLEDHSPYEREQLARINATPAAPESFDPIAALRRVEAVLDALIQTADESDRDGYRPVVDARVVCTQLHAALAPQDSR